MTYTKQTWADAPATTSPITADRLNYIEEGVQTAQETADAKYAKPGSGIPSTDLAAAAQTSLGKADTALQALTKSDLGLGNVDNTSDANKPISTAQATALAKKVETVTYSGSLTTARPTADAVYWVNYPSTPTNAQSQDVIMGETGGTDDPDLTAIAGLTPANDDFIQRKASAWTNRTPAQVKTDLGLSGTNTGDQTAVTGNAGTATTLATARNIDGQSFNGSANITVIAPGTHAAPSKTTPVDADEFPLVDSAASNTLARLPWSGLKAALKTYFDSLATNLLNKTLTNPTITNYTESVVASGTVTTTKTLDLTNGTVQTATLTASTGCTFTMPSAVAGKSFVLYLKQPSSTGNGTATFTGVKWPPAAGAPTITATAGRMDVLSFFSDGTNWYGSYVQGYTY